MGLRNKDEGNFDALYAALGEELPQEACQYIATSHSRKLLRFTLGLYQRLTRLVQCHRSGNETLAAHYHGEIDPFTARRECEFSLEFDRKYFDEAADRLLRDTEVKE